MSNLVFPSEPTLGDIYNKESIFYKFVGSSQWQRTFPYFPQEYAPEEPPESYAVTLNRSVSRSTGLTTTWTFAYGASIAAGKLVVIIPTGRNDDGTGSIVSVVDNAGNTFEQAIEGTQSNGYTCTGIFYKVIENAVTTSNNVTVTFSSGTTDFVQIATIFVLDGVNTLANTAINSSSFPGVLSDLTLPPGGGIGIVGMSSGLVTAPNCTPSSGWNEESEINPGYTSQWVASKILDSANTDLSITYPRDDSLTTGVNVIVGASFNYQSGEDPPPDPEPNYPATLVQTKNVNSGNYVESYNIVLDSPVTANSMLVIFYSYDFTKIPSISDNQGNTWKTAARANSIYRGCTIQYVQDAKPGSTTITINNGAGNYIDAAAIVREFSGFDPLVDPLDEFDILEEAGYTQNHTIGPITPSTTKQLIIAGYSGDSNQTYSLGAGGFGNLEQRNNSDLYGSIASATKDMDAIAAQSQVFSASGYVNGAGVIASFKL